MTNMNSGYVGYSMSKRASEAYENNEKPFSKWTKTDILESIECSEELYNQIKKYSVKCLRQVMLYKTSWHHTSSYCNNTNFYSVVNVYDGIIEDLEAAKEELNKKADDQEVKYVKFEYLEWVGSRRHPRAKKCEAVGILNGKWIHYSEGKKNVDTKGVYINISKDNLRGNAFTTEEKAQLKKLLKK